MAELSLFVGKGGVGKTTLASAYAVPSARQDRQGRVLLISSDPAHSLADVFEIRLGDRPKAASIPGRGRLHLWQVNAEKEFRSFIGKYKGALLSTVESGTIFTRQEIEPLLDTALPGLAEISALLAMEQPDIGLDVARAAGNLTPKPVVVICTGYASSDNSRKALELRVDYLATKPVDLKELVPALNRMIAHRSDLKVWK